MARDLKLFQTLPPLLVPALAALIMYGVVLFSPQVLYDADTFWHIAAGERMLDARAVIHTDPFSHTMPGVEWQTHEWFSEILMALAYRAAGWNGVVMLGGIAAGAAAALIAGWVARFAPPLTTIVAVTLGMGALVTSLLVRPHVIAMPLMALWVIALMLAREKDRSPPLWLAAVMVLWANLHGSYVFGLALIGPFALEALIAAPRARWLEVIWRWGLFGVACLGAALITPHGVEGLIHPFQLMTMTSLPDIVEWRPTDFSKAKGFEAGLLAVLFIAFSRGVRMPIMRLLVLLLLLHMALTHTRHVVVLGIIGPLLMAEPLGKALEPHFQGDLARRLRPVLAVLMAGLLALTTVRFVYPLVRKDGYHAPISAFEAVPADLRGKPVLNSYGLGGYLIFKDVKVFIDGRADMYGDAFTKRYLRIARGDTAELDKAIERYGIQWMFLESNAILVRTMEKKPGWRRLYKDNVATVYVRDDYGRSTSAPSSTTR
jgi:hypothetical protein